MVSNDLLATEGSEVAKITAKTTAVSYTSRCPPVLKDSREDTVVGNGTSRSAVSVRDTLPTGLPSSTVQHGLQHLSLEASGYMLNSQDVEQGGGDGGGEGGGKDKVGFSIFTLPPRKRWILALLAISNLAANTCFSLMAPFFPATAEEKGMPQTLIGLTFSIFELWVVVSSPVYGNNITRIGARFAYICGQFVAGVCSILFGMLYMSPPGVPFITLSIILRTVQSLGASAFVTASFALIATEFPDYVATVFGILEMFTGLGYVMGPLLGGVIYDVGGFRLPFYIMGGLQLGCVCLTFILMPARHDEPPAKRKKPIWKLLASPLVVVSALTVVMATYNFGFLDATLALHLEQFNLSASITGSLFMIVASLYASLSVVYGWLSDRKNLVFELLIAGNVVLFISQMLMGPSPLLPFLHTELWLIILSLVLMGMGIGAAMIPALRCFYTGARRLGFQEGLELDGMVSGLLNPAFHLGTFLGPTIGSALIDVSSYEWSSTFNSGLALLSIILLGSYLLVEKFYLHYDDSDQQVTDEATCLLQSSSSHTPPHQPPGHQQHPDNRAELVKSTQRD